MRLLKGKQVIQIVINALVWQAHRIDAAERDIVIARFGVALTGGKRCGLGNESACRRLSDCFQFLNSHTRHTSGIHQAVVKRKTGDLGFQRYHLLLLFFAKSKCLPSVARRGGTIFNKHQMTGNVGICCFIE